MKDKEFHDLIEQGNENRKKKSWDTLQKNLGKEVDSNIQNNGSNTATLIKSKRFIIFAATAVCLIAAVLLIVFLLKEEVKNEFRFYSNSEYESVMTDMTLKEYSQEKGGDILYLDWYDETDDYLDTKYFLKDTEAVICFREEIYDNNTDNYITIFVTEKSVHLEFLSIYDYLQGSYSSNSGIVVQWGGDFNKVFAKFEYGNYSYYLQIDDLSGPKEDILLYVEMLIG